LHKAVGEPDVKARILADGGDPLASTPAEYAADMAREEPKWSALIKKLGLRVE
jgi:tripartite-type tricarboxylate transporter receptor subunit TctC